MRSRRCAAHGAIARYRLMPAAALAALLLCALPAQGQQALDDLIIAVSNDRVAEVRSLLARGMDPDSVDANGDPLLIIAVRSGSLGALESLLAAKARPDRRNAHDDSPILLAALKGNLAMVRRLQAAGAPLDGPGWTPLIYAATGGHEAIVRFLLEQGARIDAASPNGTTALMMAIREHRLGVAEMLLARGADPARRNQLGLSALQYAEQGNETALAQRLRAR